MTSSDEPTAASTEPAAAQDGSGPALLFSQGTAGPHVDAYRARVAELLAEVMLARNGLYVLASNVKPNQLFMRQAAGAKVTAALLAERVLSECAHMFGGPGFLEDETLFPRVIADLRLARLGGGSNEVMWELFAQSLETDDDLYQRLTSIEAPPEPDQAV